RIVVNTQNIDPMPVITGAAEYPADLENKMKNAGFSVDAVDCLSLAEQAGTAKAVNIVLMGRLSKYIDFSEEPWLKAIEKLVKPQFLEMNKKAFMLGRG
ncbi:MAG: 2-oxoacid:acceptor oxidoreductase family protein, partial [Treponema sp.]|nr:2-oxoacid:acceptor oxidoreductase family protein [Treponema sp.]